MRENPLKELQGTSILTKEFFNKLIRRIECTKPLAGSGIEIQQEENGIVIYGGGAGGFGGGGPGYTATTLNVCSNGEPAQILVFAKPVEE
jgi:hypothetical protein